MTTHRHPGWSPAGNLLGNVLMGALRKTFAGKSPARRYKLARRMIDEAFARYRKNPELPPLGCRSAGCCGCCLHQKEIDSSEYEVEKILDRVQRDGRLQEVVERAERLTVSGKGGVCPLLSKEGACTVYDIRPLSCAAYHSLDREACHSDPEAEIRSAELLWIEAMFIAGFGQVAIEDMEEGVPIARTHLFNELARRGRARLARRKAA